MKRIAVLLAATAMSASAAFATPIDGTDTGLEHDYIVPYVGVFDILKTYEDAVQFGGEYRFHEWDFGVRPTLGINADDHGGGYAYGGFNWEIPLGNTPFLLVPNEMVGAYHQGGSKQLGGPLEFRSGIELDYEIPNTPQRVGISFNHISNASIYDHNPGAETLLINYSIPVTQIVGLVR